MKENKIIIKQTVKRAATVIRNENLKEETKRLNELRAEISYE